MIGNEKGGTWEAPEEGDGKGQTSWWQRGWYAKKKKGKGKDAKGKGKDKGKGKTKEKGLRRRRRVVSALSGWWTDGNHK